MTTLREAAQQALEALEDHAKQYPHMQKGYTVDAITALRTALEQPEPRNQCGETCERAKLCAICARGLEQEPVLRVVDGVIQSSSIPEGYTGNLYTTQPRREWQNLTDDEIKKILGPLGSWGPTPIKGYTRKLFDEIEQALKEKNA